MSLRRSSNQMKTLDNIIEPRKSAFLFINNLTPKKSGKNYLSRENLKKTAKAMRVFYNIKPTLKPQGSYRWESVNNMADMVELGNMSKKDLIQNRSRDKSNSSLWDSFIDKTETKRLSSIKIYKSSSTDNMKNLLNPKLNMSVNKESGGRIKGTIQNGFSGSIKNLLDKTPGVNIKYNSYARKRTHSTDFFILPNKKVNSIFEVKMPYVNVNNNASRKPDLYTIETTDLHTKYKPPQTNNLLNTTKLNEDKLSRNKSNNTGTTLSTTRDLRTLANNKTLKYIK